MDMESISGQMALPTKEVGETELNLEMEFTPEKIISRGKEIGMPMENLHGSTDPIAYILAICNFKLITKVLIKK